MGMIEDAILKLDAKLSSSNLHYAFLGGSVLSLLVQATEGQGAVQPAGVRIPVGFVVHPFQEVGGV